MILRMMSHIYQNDINSNIFVYEVLRKIHRNGSAFAAAFTWTAMDAFTSLASMAYIRCQNYILLVTILLCDIDITFCNMHGLFCYVMSHYAIFILYYAK